MKTFEITFAKAYSPTMMLFLQILVTNLVLVLLPLLPVYLAAAIDAILPEEFLALVFEKMLCTKERPVETGDKTKTKKKGKRHSKRNCIITRDAVAVNKVSIVFGPAKNRNQQPQESCSSALSLSLVCAIFASTVKHMEAELKAARAKALSAKPADPISAPAFQELAFRPVPTNLTATTALLSNTCSTLDFSTTVPGPICHADSTPIPDHFKAVRTFIYQKSDSRPVPSDSTANSGILLDRAAEETAPTADVPERLSVAEKLTADLVATSRAHEGALTATRIQDTGPLPKNTSFDHRITGLTFAPSGGHPSGKLSSSTEPSHALNTVDLVELEAYTGAATESGSCRMSPESSSGTAALLLDDELVSPGSAGATAIAGTRVLSSAGSSDSTLCGDAVAPSKAEETLDKGGGQTSNIDVYSVVVDDIFYARPWDITFRSIHDAPAQPAIEVYADTLAGETTDVSSSATASSCYEDGPPEAGQQNFNSTTPIENEGAVAASWEQPQLSEVVRNAMNGIYGNPYLLPSTASSSPSESGALEQRQEPVAAESCSATMRFEEAVSAGESSDSMRQSLCSGPPTIYSAPMSFFGRQLSFEVTFEAPSPEVAPAPLVVNTEAVALPTLPHSPPPSSSSGTSDDDEGDTGNDSPRPPQSSDDESWSSSSSEEEDEESHFTKRLHTLKDKFREKTQPQRDWWRGISTEKKKKIHNKVKGRKVHFAEEPEVRYFLQTDLTEKEDPCETVLRHWMPPKYGSILKGPHRKSLRETLRRKTFTYFRLPDPLSEVLKEPEAEDYLQQKQLFKAMYPNDSYDEYLKLKRREAREDAFDAEWRTLRTRQKIAIKLYLKHKYRQGFRLFARVARNKAAKQAKNPTNSEGFKSPEARSLEAKSPEV